MRLEHQGDRYFTLDGLRGVAAVVIAVLHIPHFTGGWHFENSFLAVDLFFLLSGFVLARTYEPRFRSGMGVGEFFRLRVARLFPFYILGSILGVFVAIAAIHFGGGGLLVPWSTPKLAVTMLFSGIMLPTPGVSGNELLYPLNPVLWSIFFELMANVAYVVAWRLVQRDRLLSALIIMFAALLTGLTLAGYGLDGGFTWATIPVGIARVGFSFFSGVLIARHSTGRRVVDGTAAAVCVIALPVLFALKGGAPYQLACIFAGFPALIIIASRVEPSASLAKVFEVLGICSYPMYALHKPLYQLSLGAITKAVHVLPESLAPWLAVGFIPAIAGVSWILTAIYERPIRLWFARYFDISRARMTGIRA